MYVFFALKATYVHDRNKRLQCNVAVSSTRKCGLQLKVTYMNVISDFNAVLQFPQLVTRKCGHQLKAAYMAFLSGFNVVSQFP